MRSSVKEALIEILRGDEGRLVQEGFSQATGLRLGIWARDGEFLGPHDSTPAVCDFVMSSEAGKQECETCLDQLAEQVDAAQGAVIKCCHAGLAVFGAPIEVGDEKAAFCVGRAVFVDPKARHAFVQYASGLGVSEDEAFRELRAVPVWSSEQLEAVGRLMASQANALLNRDMHRRVLEQRLDEMTSLYEASKALSPTMEFEELLDKVLDGALATMGADGGSVMLVDHSRSTLRVHAARGVSADASAGVDIPVGTGIAGWVAKEGEPLLLVGDVKDPRFKSLAPKQVIRSAISVPLLGDGRVVGVLNVNNTSEGRQLDEDDLKVLRLFAERASSAIENSRLYKLANEQITELTSFNELSRSLNSTLDVGKIVGLFCEILSKLIRFDAGGILLRRDGGAEMHCVLEREVSRADLDDVTKLALGALKRHSRVDIPASAVTEMTELGRKLSSKKRKARPSRSFVSMPLIVKDSCTGIVFASSFDRDAFDANNVRTLSTLSSQVAVSLENAGLYRNLRENYDKTISALSATIDAKDHYTRGHSERVMELAIAIGEKLDLAEEDLDALRFAGLLHDIGKIGISEEILLKPAALTEAEMSAVRAHSAIGANIIDQIDFLNSLTPVVLHHHERYGGGGYPDGLVGNEIPLLARILAVADSYEAMTSKRAYRDALSTEQAVSELLRCAGTQFDPVLVQTMIGVLEKELGPERLETIKSVVEDPEDHVGLSS